MKRNKVEFEVGDTVTFNANGTPHTTVVKGVDIDVLCGGKDERIFYLLDGPKVVYGLKCSGTCIEESIYYEADKQ